MAKDKLKKRVRKAVRKELRRREAQRRPLGPGRGSGPDRPASRRGTTSTGPTGPRRRPPTAAPAYANPGDRGRRMPAAALELDEPEPQYLDLTR